MESNQKQIILKKTKEILYPLFTMGIVFLFYYLLFSSHSFYPFDKQGNTVLMIDAQSEYIAYLRYMKRILSGQESFFYITSKTFGGDFLSIYTFYLASPFNFLLPLFEDSQMPAFILVTSMMKMTLAGFNMYLFLRSKTDHPSLFLIACSFSYSFIAYAFIYMSNYMWLDGVMILPLVILGLEKLKNRQNKWLYPLSLCYSLLTSWYIGAMICIFCVCYFFSYYFKDKKRDKKEIQNFFLFSLGGGLLSAILWVPAFLHFSGTKVHSNFPSFSFYPISTLLKGFVSDSYTDVSLICKNEGYLPAFSSLVCLYFALHYFFNKGYPLRERICSLCLFGFYFLMSLTSVTTTLLHFGSVPTWFPFRYAFLFSFLTIFLGFQQGEKMEKEGLVSFLIANLVLILCALLVFFLPDYNKETLSFNKTSCAILLITMLFSFISILISKITIFTEKGKSVLIKACQIAIIPLCIYSSYKGGDDVLKTNEKSNMYQTYQTYEKDDSYSEVVNRLKDYDQKQDYRMEMTFNRPGNYNQVNNNPMFYGYNGISHFSSSEKQDVMSYMRKLGFHYNGFFEGYDNGSTVSMNSFLGIKYLIDDSTDSFNNQPHFFYQLPFRELNNLYDSERKEIRYYENTSALSLGLVTQSYDSDFISEGRKLSDGRIHWYDHFEYQNELFHALSGSIKEDIFTKVTYALTLDGMKQVDTDLETEDCFFSGKKGDKMKLFFTEKEESFPYNLYFCTKDLNSNFDYYIDNRKVNIATYHHNGIQNIPNNSRKSHTITLICKKDIEKENVRLELYKENLNILTSYTNAIKKKTPEEFKRFHSAFTYGYEGSFYKTEEKDTSFVFTLPYEKDFTIYIDGKKQSLTKRFNIFSACSLKEIKNGKHTIKIVYQDKGFLLGIMLSFIGLLYFLFLLLFLKSGKYYRKTLTKDL